MRKSHVKWLILAVMVLIALVFLMGCGPEKYTEPYKDAPRGATNNDKADLITFPDGFSNVSTKCDHGNRVYSAYHGDHPYGTIAVVPDAKGC